MEVHNFLSAAEIDLSLHAVSLVQDAFAWDESEKGALSEEYFPPVHIPTIEHIPWRIKNIPIPPALHDRIVEIIKDKMKSKVYEPSNSSYRSSWFCVLKKDGKSLRLVHDLQPLNAVSILDPAVPPSVDTLAESFAGRACYTTLDLFVAFDQRKLHPDSRDLTTFQSPFGPLRLTSLPMGYTNSQQIMHGDVCFILRDEIPHVTIPFIDDVPLKGPKSRHQLPDGSYKTVEGNAEVRLFIYEHLLDFIRVCHRFRVVGATLSGKKITLCAPQAVVVGHLCTEDGRVVDPTRTQCIQDWPEPRNVSEVRQFLGTCGVVRIFIKNYAQRTRALTQLLRKDLDFEFGEDQRSAFMDIKEAIISSPALRPLDYQSGRPIVLKVDSSPIGFGVIVLQEGEDARRYPSRFLSGCWNATESRYSQPKRELYGLFRGLRAVRLYIAGYHNVIIEVDAKFIKGMINNPDLQPNATINRWIAGILLFEFRLVHVPGETHAADGTSRRRRAPGDPEPDTEFDDWIDEQYGFTLLVDEIAPQLGLAFTTTVAEHLVEDDGSLPQSARSIERDEFLAHVRSFLDKPERPEGMSDNKFRAFIRSATRFFLRDGHLWRRSPDGEHKQVLPRNRRLVVLRAAHDELGHKGYLVVRTRVRDRFWWPLMDADIAWFIRSCHECQSRQLTKVHIPPRVPPPPGLFQHFHVDAMNMPLASGYRHIVQARCALTGWVEYRILRSDNANAIFNFLFEDIVCRYGPYINLTTDNGATFVSAVSRLKQYIGHHVTISAYNSQANGIVERANRDLRETIVKLCKGELNRWPTVAPYAIWAERVTIKSTTGASPYALMFGVEPTLPFDLLEATYMSPPLDTTVSYSDLLVRRADALRRRNQSLDAIKGKVMKARIRAAERFYEEFKNTIREYDFQPGDLIMARNTRIEKELNRKAKPRYLGPLVVVRRTRGGSYLLADMTGAIFKSSFAAFRLIPYFERRKLTIPVIEHVQRDDADLDHLAQSTAEPEDDGLDFPHLLPPDDDEDIRP